MMAVSRSAAAAHVKGAICRRPRAFRLARSSGVGFQLIHGFGPSRHIIRINQERGLTADLGHCAFCRCHHGTAAGHGFGGGKTKPFGKRREQQTGRIFIKRAQGGIRHAANSADVGGCIVPLANR